MSIRNRFPGVLVVGAVIALTLAGCTQHNRNMLGKRAQFDKRSTDGIVIYGMRKTRQSAFMELGNIEFIDRWVPVDPNTDILENKASSHVLVKSAVGPDEVTKTKFFIVRMPAAKYALLRMAARKRMRPPLGLVVEPGSVMYVGDFTVVADSRPNWYGRVKVEWSGFSLDDAKAELAKYQGVSGEIRKIRMTPVKIKVSREKPKQ